MRTLVFAALFLTLAACDSGGDGVAEADSTVTVAYEGRLKDGRVFDRNARATFSLRNVIPGFRDGIVGMEVGDSRTFDIPPAEGYGNNPPRGSIITASDTLVFDVTLLDVD